VGRVCDQAGALRRVFPTSDWQDYLALAFDEIRQYGSSSVQVMRRMRSALAGFLDSLLSEDRKEAVREYLQHLDRGIEKSPLDVEDRRMAREEDRQGIGLTRRHKELN
jgi:uncharacterized membrane protein